MFKCAINKSSS